MNNPLYLRTYLPDSGGDALIGRDTGTVQDTLISPPAAYQRIGTRELMYLTASGKKVSPDDFSVTLSADSITEEALRDPNTQFVIKEGTTEEEVLRIIYIDSKGFQGTTVAWLVIARSVSTSV
jgi:hypothetical protein